MNRWPKCTLVSIRVYVTLEAKFMISQSTNEIRVAQTCSQEYLPNSDYDLIKSQLNLIKTQNENILSTLSLFDWRAVSGFRMCGLILYYICLPIKLIYNFVCLIKNKFFNLFKYFKKLKKVKKLFNMLSLWYIAYLTIFEVLALKELLLKNRTRNNSHPFKY